MNDIARGQPSSKVLRLMMGLACAGLLTLEGVPRAQAQSTPQTVIVTLRNGTVLQGELVEKVPGDHVTLKLATGEVRTIPASDLLASHLGNLEVPSFTELASTLHSDRDFAGADGVQLHIETDKPYATYLFQAAAAGPSVGWNRLCLAPCDVKVDPRALYKIGGERIVDSDTFHLRPGPKQTLYVDAVGAGTPAFAWIGTILGVALTVPAVYLLTRPADPKDDTGATGAHIAGFVLLANGIPWLGIGIAMFVVGGTTVKNDTGERLAKQAPSALPSLALGGPFRLSSAGVTF